MTEAAELTGIPRSTMAVWVRTGRFPRVQLLQLGKVRTAYYVPITDLIAAGLVSRRKAAGAPTPRYRRDIVDRLHRRNQQLEADAARLRAEVERLDLLNREQQAIIASLRRQLERRKR